VSAGRRYTLGLLLVAGAAAALIAVLQAGREGWLALGLAVLVQAPLGWWLVESVGKPRFLGVWVTGMLGRLAVVGIAGLAIVPLMHLRPAAMLVPLVLLLTVFVLLEGVVLMGQHSVQHPRVEIR
jgi:hypothetical protein